MSSVAQLLMTCNVVAKMEASLRKILKSTVLSSKPDENNLFVCTIYFRTEEVVVLRHKLHLESIFQWLSLRAPPPRVESSYFRCELAVHPSSPLQSSTSSLEKAYYDKYSEGRRNIHTLLWAEEVLEFENRDRHEEQLCRIYTTPNSLISVETRSMYYLCSEKKGSLH